MTCVKYRPRARQQVCERYWRCVAFWRRERLIYRNYSPRKGNPTTPFCRLYPDLNQMFFFLSSHGSFLFYPDMGQIRIFQISDYPISQSGCPVQKEQHRVWAKQLKNHLDRDKPEVIQLYLNTHYR